MEYLQNWKGDTFFQGMLNPFWENNDWPKNTFDRTIFDWQVSKDSLKSKNIINTFWPTISCKWQLVWQTRYKVNFKVIVAIILDYFNPDLTFILCYTLFKYFQEPYFVSTAYNCLHVIQVVTLLLDFLNMRSFKTVKMFLQSNFSSSRFIKLNKPDKILLLNIKLFEFE